MLSRSRLFRSLLGTAALVAILIWAAIGCEFELARLGQGIGRATEYVGQMFPPDRRVLPDAWTALLVTVQMAIVGTFLGFALALPVSFLAARTSPLPPVVPMLVKAGLNTLRAIPVYIYAVLFVYMVGLGPFPGALGIGVGTFVMLAKLFAEALESVNPAPVEAVRAVGGTPLQVFRFGMLPQAWPQFLSQTLYAWELSIGAATILGVVGAGGIGYELIKHIRYFEWHKVLTYLVLMIGMVLAADAISYRLRRRLV
jgi:phosphonate transport system permease protein